MRAGLEKETHFQKAEKRASRGRAGLMGGSTDAGEGPSGENNPDGDAEEDVDVA